MSLWIRSLPWILVVITGRHYVMCGIAFSAMLVYGYAHQVCVDTPFFLFLCFFFKAACNDILRLWHLIEFKTLLWHDWVQATKKVPYKAS